MFPLLTKTFPASAAELEGLLNASLREVLITKSDPVRILDRNYPALQQIELDLNGAAIRPNPPKPRVAKGERAPALTVAQLSLRGEGIAIGPASINFVLDASEVHLHRGLDAMGEIVLSLERVASGRVEITTSKADLEAAIGEVAKSEAGKHGVAVDDVRLTLRQLGPRALEVEINLRARKAFFAASVRISVQAEIDDELKATVSRLRCNGEGVIGSLACGFLGPHLEKVDGRSFALMALSLGEVRLREIHLSVADPLSVTAEFSA